MALYHCVIVSFWHCVIVALCHCVIVSLYKGPESLHCHCVIWPIVHCALCHCDVSSSQQTTLGRTGRRQYFYSTKKKVRLQKNAIICHMQYAKVGGNFAFCDYKNKTALEVLSMHSALCHLCLSRLCL